MGQEFHGLK